MIRLVTDQLLHPIIFPNVTDHKTNGKLLQIVFGGRENNDSYDDQRIAHVIDKYFSAMDNVYSINLSRNFSSRPDIMSCFDITNNDHHSTLLNALINDYVCKLTDDDLIRIVFSHNNTLRVLSSTLTNVTPMTQLYELKVFYPLLFVNHLIEKLKSLGLNTKIQVVTFSSFLATLPAPQMARYKTYTLMASVFSSIESLFSSLPFVYGDRVTSYIFSLPIIIGTPHFNEAYGYILGTPLADNKHIMKKIINGSHTETNPLSLLHVSALPLIIDFSLSKDHCDDNNGTVIDCNKFLK
jgi:hypothetical protein